MPAGNSVLKIIWYGQKNKTRYGDNQSRVVESLDEGRLLIVGWHYDKQNPGL